MNLIRQEFSTAKNIALFLILSFLNYGCATSHQTPTVKEISQKRADAEGLILEMAVFNRQLDFLEKRENDISTKSLQQESDELDKRIAAIKRAKDEVIQELNRAKNRTQGF